MGDDDPAFGLRADMIGQHTGDVIIGQAVEPVPDDAFVTQRAGQGEQGRQRVLRAVKPGVEAGDLGKVRQPFRHGPDSRKVVGLVQGGQRHKLIQLPEDIIVQAHGLAEMPPAMHDPMPDHREGSVAKVPLKPVQQQCNQVLMAGSRAELRKLCRGQGDACFIFRRKDGRAPDARDLAENAGARVWLFRFENREFQAR